MIHSLCPLFFVEAGLEPIAVELSGGQFLPPVQKLVATLIFARPTQGQTCKSSPVTLFSFPGHRNRTPGTKNIPTPIGAGIFLTL